MSERVSTVEARRLRLPRRRSAPTVYIDAPLERNHRPIAWVILQHTAQGTWLGFVSGVTTGTAIFPLYGSFVGAAVGALAGFVIGLVASPFVMEALRQNVGSIRRALIKATVASVVVTLACGGAALVWLAEGDYSMLFWLSPALLPAAVAAACAARYDLQTLITTEQAGLLNRRAFTPLVVRLWHVLVASGLAAALFWVAYTVYANAT